MIIQFDRPTVMTVHKISGGTPVRFLPGANEIEETDWAEIQKDPTIKGMCEEGTLKVLSSKGGGDTQLPLKDAEKVIAQTFDIQLLEKWKATEKRKPIVAAIEKQLAMIEEKTKVEKKKSEEDEES